MKAKDITSETFPKALRTVRLRAGLSQRNLSRRTKELRPPLKALTQGQISAFERGAYWPRVSGLLSYLVACSADGKSLDFSLLQQALEIDDDPEEPLREPPLDACVWRSA